MIRAVLIDDEPQSSKLLSMKLAGSAVDVEVLATFDKPKEALIHLAELAPQVVFLDIEMPGLNGFQFLEKLGENDTEIIFVTAYNEYVLQALRISAFDYLLKPVDKKDLEESLTRLQETLLNRSVNQTSAQVQLLAQALQEPRRLPTRVALPTAQGVLFIRLSEIIRVEASSNYTNFYCKDRPKITVSKTLKEYEQMLSMQHFYRINRSCIVNLEFITELRKADGGSILMQDGTCVDIAPYRKQELLERLQGL